MIVGIRGAPAEWELRTRDADREPFEADRGLTTGSRDGVVTGVMFRRRAVY